MILGEGYSQAPYAQNREIPIKKSGKKDPPQDPPNYTLDLLEILKKSIKNHENSIKFRKKSGKKWEFFWGGRGGGGGSIAFGHVTFL